jgi:plasmid stabilization system protein ParE
LKLEFSPSARRDLASIREYIAEDNREAAERTLIRIQQSIRYLKLFPELGAPWRETDTRALSIPGLPFRVHYEIVGDAVIVLNIIHTSRLWP